MNLTLPTDSDARKEIPIWRGCIRYFAAALAGVARISKQGNDKHNPGESMHHARWKSMDHLDCVFRHAMDADDLMTAWERASVPPTPAHCAQILDEVDQFAWRALAWSQEMHERYGGAPLAPGARVQPSSITSVARR